MELDLVEMFPNIPRDEVETALSFLHSELMKKMGETGCLNFFIARGGMRRLDNCTQGDRASFMYFTFHDVLAYTAFDIVFNTLFCASSLVFTQVTGTPIGGSLSAQIASPVLIARELNSESMLDLRQTDWRWIRYRDNFIVHMFVSVPPDRDQETVMRDQATRAMGLFNAVFGDRTRDNFGNIQNELKWIGLVCAPSKMDRLGSGWCNPPPPCPNGPDHGSGCVKKPPCPAPPRT